MIDFYTFMLIENLLKIPSKASKKMFREHLLKVLLHSKNETYNYWIAKKIFSVKL